MPDSLLFSVIVPTCHRNDSLALCLDRLAPGAQTLSPDRYEVIVTDDGSNTTAEELARQRYPWAQWTQCPRRGPAANRNHAASLARGAWLAFTDDDCVPELDWLAAYSSAVTGEARALEGTIRPIGNLEQDLAECPVNLRGGSFWSANVAVQRALFEQLGGFDERYRDAAHEDEDLQLRLREHTRIEFVAHAQVLHPVRVLTLSNVLRRMDTQARSTALYYALNDRRLGIRRFTTLIRWLYKPRILALCANAVRLRPRSALVEAMWVLYGNARVLSEYSKTEHALATTDP